MTEHTPEIEQKAERLRRAADEVERWHSPASRAAYGIIDKPCLDLIKAWLALERQIPRSDGEGHHIKCLHACNRASDAIRKIVQAAIQEVVRRQPNTLERDYLQAINKELVEAMEEWFHPANSNKRFSERYKRVKAAFAKAKAEGGSDAENTLSTD